MPVLIGGGMDHNYYNNIFMDSDIAIHLDNRFTHWASYTIERGGVIDKRLEAVKHRQAPFSEAYPELVNYWDESPENPKRNQFHGNLFYKIKNVVKGQSSFGEFWNNWAANENPGFVDENDPLKGFVPEAEVFKRIKGFENIDFGNIGSTLDKTNVLK